MPANASRSAEPARRAGESSPPPPSDDDLASYVRQSLTGTIWLLLALLLGLGLATVLFEPQLLGATTWIFAKVGLLGLTSILFVTDSIVSPFPPDLVLVVIAKSELAASWTTVIPALGVVSVLAGNVGYALGRLLSGTRAPDFLFGKVRAKNEALVARFGRWAIVLGALTPIPFSITCWTAGMLKMTWRSFAPMTLLRIPRFIAYYAAIAHLDALMRALGGG